jgi:hypothetical protein
MMEELKYLYRGTTECWPGNPCLQAQCITCTTRDPLVATLFAVECRSHGKAVVQAAPLNRFVQLIGPPNHFQVIESAVNLSICPEEFTKQVDVTLEVDDVIEILREMGFTNLPVRLYGIAALRFALAESHAEGIRLNREQIRNFNSRMLEGRS